MNRIVADRPFQRRLLFGIVFTLGTLGCEVTTPSVPLFVGITEIEVVGVTDVQPFSDLLEVEVHMFDAVTQRFLGCSGQDSGLRDVDYSDIAYLVNATLQAPPDGGGDLTMDAVLGRSVYLVVVEDDTEACPAVTNEGTLDLITDDLIGVSPILSGSEIADGVALSFDQVAYLFLEPIR